MKVKVVTAFVPLNVRHVSREKYYELGDRLVRACGEDRIRVFKDRPLTSCWAYSAMNYDGIVPAQPVPEDRYAHPRDMLASNIVQHNRTTWAMEAAAMEPEVDCWVWLDFGILKQGDFTGRPVTEDIVKRFLDRLEERGFSDIPFPGIWGQGAISQTGDNWRFCGSTHIWLRQYLTPLDLAYRFTLLSWIGQYKTIPNDLPIWALVERDSGLPFRWYSANHDASQLEHFPCET